MITFSSADISDLCSHLDISFTKIHFSTRMTSFSQSTGDLGVEGFLNTAFFCNLEHHLYTLVNTFKNAHGNHTEYKDSPKTAAHTGP
jgi:hypothetical protein